MQRNISAYALYNISCQVQNIIGSTIISSVFIISTEQWVLATKSAWIPNAPAHRKSPTTAPPPIESLLIIGILHVKQVHTQNDIDSTYMYQDLNRKFKCLENLNANGCKFL